MYALVRQNNYRSYKYELFQLITEKHNLKLQQNNYTKAYHIIYLLCRYDHVESKNIYIYYVLCFFCNLL